MTLAQAEPLVVYGSTYPRIATPPLIEGPAGTCGCGCALTPETSYGFVVVDFAAMIGRPLDHWQRYLAIHACELLPDGRPRFRRIIILVARQNGKTEFCAILVLFWMFVERVPLVLGTSSKLTYARESWRKAIELARESPDLARDIGNIRNTNGEEEFGVAWGSRYLIAAANEDAGRSLTVYRLILDELRQHHDYGAYSASSKTTNAVRDAQIFMPSNAGSDRSVVLNDFREQAIAGHDKRLGIFEWSAPEGMEPDDPEALAMANPSLGYRMDIDALLGEAQLAKENGGEQLTEFITEVLCRRVAVLNPAVDIAAWAKCLDAGGLEGNDNVALCLDVAISGNHATLYAAAPVSSSIDAHDVDRVRVDVVQAWDGPGALAAMRAELPALVTRIHPKVLGWFPGGPSAAVAAALEDRTDWPPVGVKVEAIRGEVQAVCMGFAEQVRALQIAHSDDPLLNAHLASAEKYEYGDGWRFGRKGTDDVDAAYAAAGAVHLARTLPQTSIGVMFV